MCSLDTNHKGFQKVKENENFFRNKNTTRLKVKFDSSTLKIKPKVERLTKG